MREKDKPKSLRALAGVVAGTLGLAACGGGPSEADVRAALMRAYEDEWKAMGLVDRAGRGSPQALASAPHGIVERSHTLRVPLKVRDAGCDEELEAGEKAAEVWRCRPRMTAGPRPEIAQAIAAASDLGPWDAEKVRKRWSPVVAALTTGRKIFTTSSPILLWRGKGSGEWAATLDFAAGETSFPRLVPAKTD